MAGDWTDEQNDGIVADYFAMLAEDIVGRPYSKAEHNRLMQASIGRPRGSIEYKHQNISAVLKGLGQDWRQAGCGRQSQLPPSLSRVRSWISMTAGGSVASTISHLVQRPDFDLARSRHGIGAALHPGDRLVHVLDLHPS
jgi:hypothetical protein